jgi:hypothetical protein
VSLISIGTSQCVPKEELISEAEGVNASFRLLGGGGNTGRDGGKEAPQKPWWRLW